MTWFNRSMAFAAGFAFSGVVAVSVVAIALLGYGSCIPGWAQGDNSRVVIVTTPVASGNVVPGEDKPSVGAGVGADDKGIDCNNPNTWYDWFPGDYTKPITPSSSTPKPAFDGPKSGRN